MYLSYEQYLHDGGLADESAFNIAVKKAEYLINSQAGGQTGPRIKAMETIPQAVTDCAFFLVEHLINNTFDNSNIQSESQSQGGKSESVTYISKTDEELRLELENIICDTFYGANIGYLLYRGACV